ncbi:S24 family peptidase [Adhaeribacter radiodurans]|uniref:Peptidase S24/S26A/S26B/S26C domain-containing protein n=1 Tax=Adhaeribacter radiodurans TaxID=2745197 RepID=A0A7L7LCQ8_9BACT|nr:S24 family peptidase [Adhaeribacter radiodurans]QMU30159.1 hypothetical protein HUW48_19935 [Adhaeribacter radiodurans]
MESLIVSPSKLPSLARGIFLERNDNFNEQDPEAEYIIKHRGDSMLPFIGPGDHLKVRMQKPDSWIQFGCSYLIFTSQLAFVARIYKGSTPDKWLLKRDNSEHYNDQEIDKSLVKGLFIITQILKTIC